MFFCFPVAHSGCQPHHNSMKLPNSDRAVVDIAKLRDYSLNPNHPEAKHKARVFVAALDLTMADADWLRNELLQHAHRSDCQLSRRTDYGQRYFIDCAVTRQGRSARLRRAGIVRAGENFPRLTTCCVLSAPHAEDACQTA
jgi:hypothetical protein